MTRENTATGALEAQMAALQQRVDVLEGLIRLTLGIADDIATMVNPDVDMERFEELARLPAPVRTEIARVFADVTGTKI